MVVDTTGWVKVDEPYQIVRCAMGEGTFCFYAEKVLERRGSSAFVSRSEGPYATRDDAVRMAEWLSAEPQLD